MITLLPPLHEVLCQCWKEGAVPQDMRDSKIITLYKNKGERNDCNNYRGISLLSIVGKVFDRDILIRLQKQAERIYPESQCGFRADLSTIDMVFSLRQLIAAKTCIRHNNRRNLPSYPIRWQALQHRPSPSQDKCSQGSHQGHAVC